MINRDISPPLDNRYMFSRPLAFSTIPKAFGFEAATRFPSILLGGSLIPIVVIGMGMALPWLNTYPAEAGIQLFRSEHCLRRDYIVGFCFPQ